MLGKYQVAFSTDMPRVLTMGSATDPDSDEFGNMITNYLNINDDANHYINTYHRGISRSIKNMLDFCIYIVYKKLLAEHEHNVSVGNFEWFEQLDKNDMHAIVKTLYDNGYGDLPHFPALKPTIECIKQMQKDKSILNCFELKSRSYY